MAPAQILSWLIARAVCAGKVGGEVHYQGGEGGPEKVRHRIGFVDQEDTLMSTMTVYESVGGRKDEVMTIP
jgi:ABC-type multidrug transport system ATPase subunit